MSNQKASFKTGKELQEIILQEKTRGAPDLEIGQKYGVTFRYIEKLKIWGYILFTAIKYG